MVSLDDVRRAREATTGLVWRTPLLHSPDLSRRTGAKVYLKLENLQVTGSFKSRGPSYKLQTLTPAERTQGVVAATAGNHGVGLALAGQRLEVPVHIHIAENADADKLELLRQHEATLHFADDFEQAHFNALMMAESDGLALVSAYSDPHVIAADGVIGLEILEDQPETDLVIVPVGGGGLAAGISLVMKAGSQPVEAWGIEAAKSPSFNTWFATGIPDRIDLEESIAEGLAGYIEPDTMTWPLVREHVNQMLTASEAELVEGMRWMVQRHRMVVEASGAAAIAAIRRAGKTLAGRTVVGVISGGNIAWQRFLRLLEEFPPTEEGP